MIAFASRRWTGGGGAAAGGVSDPRGAWELVALFALYLATIVMTVTSMRIRLALVPMLLPFAGYAVDLVLRRARPSAWAPALALAALVVYWPVYPRSERAEDLLERDYNLAVDLLREGRFDAAEPLVAELSNARPGTISVTLLEAELAYRRGATAHAAGAPAAEVEREFDRALKLLRPLATGATGDGVPPRDRFRAQKLAGLVQYDAGNWDAAERRFREALAFDPDDADLRVLLARIEAARDP
jgi:tetratricopeptide (TPR) repeat protein